VEEVEKVRSFKLKKPSTYNSRTSPLTKNTEYDQGLKTISFVRAQQCCAPTASSIYVVYRRKHRRIIKKSLETSYFR
jgi:hypothetical protein